MPNRIEFDVQGDGVRLHVVGTDVASPRGAIVIAPGFAEHTGRWTRFMDELAARGYAAFAVDPRGHGRSSGPRGHTPSWSALLGDLTSVFDALRKAERLPPRVGLLGASMGGLIAIEWVAAHPGQVQGLVLVSPFLEPAMRIPPHKLALARTVGRAIPRLAQAHGLKGKMVTHDAALIAQYDADPHQTRVMTSGYFLERRAAQARARRLGPKLDLPVLVLAGGADPVASVPAIEEFAGTLPAGKSRLIVYAGLYHEPLNEVERVRVFADLTHWLDRNVVGQDRPGP
jgi:alpha-beta hydrolase superfamily lysophospholipase